MILRSMKMNQCVTMATVILECIVKENVAYNVNTGTTEVFNLIRMNGINDYN